MRSQWIAQTMNSVKAQIYLLRVIFFSFLKHAPLEIQHKITFVNEYNTFAKKHVVVDSLMIRVLFHRYRKNMIQVVSKFNFVY